ncbi:MAG: cytochrome c oxidase subunit 3 [Flavobacteriales bacterium]|nr:cytochrome c oxidase subunit 3 [Flavobacteriales bacterium]
MTKGNTTSANTGNINAEDRERASKFLLWLGIISMIMIFAALTSAIIVRKSDSNWYTFEIPVEFTISTLVLLVSSISMILAVFFTRKSQKGAATLFLFITLALGSSFAWLQFEGWKQLVKNNIYFVDNLTGNISGSFFYVITALHLLHLFGGLLAVFVTTLRSAAGKYSPSNYLGLKLCAIFWHFLDGLWLYLFLFLQFSDQII